MADLQAKLGMSLGDLVAARPKPAKKKPAAQKQKKQQPKQQQPKQKRQQQQQKRRVVVQQRGGNGRQQQQRGGGAMRSDRGRQRAAPYGRGGNNQRGGGGGGGGGGAWGRDRGVGGGDTRAPLTTGTTLFVSNLDRDGITDQDINELFERIGSKSMKYANINYDRAGKSKGTAEVAYRSHADALEEGK